MRLEIGIYKAYRISVSVFTGLLCRHSGLSLIRMRTLALFKRGHIDIVDLITPSEKGVCATGLLYCTMLNPKEPGCHMVTHEVLERY